MSKPHALQDATQVLARKPNIGIVHACGTSVPSDGVIGYAPGCIFQDLDGAAGLQVYINEGTALSADFNALTGLGTTVVTLTATTLVNTAINAAAAAATLTVKAATQHAWEVTDGTTISIDVDTRTTTSGGGAVTLLGQPLTLASAGSVFTAPTLDVAAKTVTLTGTTTTTSLLGVAARFEAQTITDASVCTLTTASAIHIVALAAAGGSLTITNSRMISTSVTDCFLTNAGVWTDTACWAEGKEMITTAAKNAIETVLDKLNPRTWFYRAEVHGNDLGRQRVGIVYDELPPELRAPGQERGVSAGLLASFCLAALKVLRDENVCLKRRLDDLEGMA